MILFIILLVVYIIIVLKYNPNFDIIYSNNTKTLVLWYTKQSKNNIRLRDYIKLFVA